MLPAPATVQVPIQEDDQGVIRVSGTRVTLKTIIERYNVGDSPSVIHEDYPSVPLPDVYAVIAYYLANRKAIDTYIQAVRARGERLRQQIEATYTPEQRARLTRLRKLAEQRQDD